MCDKTAPQDDAAMSPASAGSVAEGSLNAYLAWRDQTIASGDSDVNPFMVWSAGVRYATLTDAELEAVERAIDTLVGIEDLSADSCKQDDGAACTLRGLLERLK